MAVKDLSIGSAHAKGNGRTISGFMTEFVTTSAAAWRVSTWSTVLLLLTPFFIMAIGVLSAFLGKRIYLLVTGEDGIAENLQVIVYIITLVLAVRMVHTYWQAQERLIALLYVVLCCGLVFLTGEEISWGQRIFGWSTTGVFAEINEQQETNLHNIEGVQELFKWVQMLVGAYGLFLPLMVKRWGVFPALRKLVVAITPHESLIPYFGAMFFWKLYRNLITAPGHWEFRLSEYNEVIELVLALGLFWFMVFQTRRHDTRHSEAE